MDLQHEMYMRALSGRLHVAPLVDMKDKRVLDLGTGTGIWCVDMGKLCISGDIRATFLDVDCPIGDAYPDSEVNRLLANQRQI